MRWKQTWLFILFFILFYPVITHGQSLEKQNDTDTLRLFDYYSNKVISLRYVNPDSAIIYAKKAISLGKDINNEGAIVDIYVKLINTLTFKSRYGEAVSKLKELEKYLKDRGLQEQTVINTLYGNLYSTLGFSSKAFEYFLKSEEDESSKYYKFLTYNIASVYYDLGEYEKCREYAKKSLTVKQANNKRSLDISSLILLSNTFNNYDSAMVYLQKAMDYVRKSPDLVYEKAVILFNEAFWADAVGKIEESKQKYLEAIRIAEKNHFNQLLALLYNNYAYTLMYEQKYDSARVLLDSAVSIARQFEDLSLESSIYDTYSDLYQAKGDYKTALKYLKKSRDKSDEFKKQQQINTSLFLSAMFETAKKEKELLLKEKQLLEKENQLNKVKFFIIISLGVILTLILFIIYFRQRMSLQKARLEAVEKARSLEIADALIKGQDEERKRLSMDLHDGLGARLGALKLKVESELNEYPVYFDLISSIDEIARNVRELSHRMMPARLEELGLVHSLRNLIKSVSVSSGIKIEFETNVKQKLDKKIQVNLYYLAYELINNALKHSKGKNLFIQLFIHEDSLTLSAEDDGVGFDVNKQGDGHGLKNIKQRVEYLNGKIIIESAPGKGATFMIEIPMK